jgi:hypothetical protein
MEYFSRSRPVLVTNEMQHYFKRELEKAQELSMTWYKRFYDNFVAENKLLCFLILVLICVLIYLYLKKNVWKETYANVVKAPYPVNNTFTDDYVQPHSLQFGGFDGLNEKIARPTFNPYYPVNTQESYVNYLPEQIPVISNGTMIDNVKTMPYNAPKLQPSQTDIQYSGPYYRDDNVVVSDDLYQDFAQANVNNLDQFDELLRQKTRDDFMHGRINELDGYENP